MEEVKGDVSLFLNGSATKSGVSILLLRIYFDFFETPMNPGPVSDPVVVNYEVAGITNNERASDSRPNVES
jgi:hypothetical protein